MREKKFNFGNILFGAPKEETKYLSIYNGLMTMSIWTADSLDITGKIIDFSWDPEKHALGFRVIQGYTNIEDVAIEKSMRIIKSRDKVATTSITKILKAIGLQQSTFKKLPIDKYEDPLLGTLWYVKLKEDINNNNNESIS